MTSFQTAPRDLFGPGQTGAIRDLLQSLFVAELLQPSRCLWMAFGWISDVEILDNRARQFGALMPDWPSAGIRLSHVLKAIIERGGSIALVLREVEHNRNFISRLDGIRQRHSARLMYAFGDDVHKKGILGDDFLLNGSMNLTYNGITVNDEHVTLRTDPASVEEWRLVMEQKWKGALK
jgi:phosphatidylserine/phosphatidylglycerophosphate/cardiolipin synthase-like enzyme